MKSMQVFGWLYIGLAIAIGKPGKAGVSHDVKPAMQAAAQAKPSGVVPAVIGTNAVPEPKPAHGF